MPSKLNDPTREMTIVNVDDHPIFNRLWGKEGFVRVNEENLEEFKSAKGLVLIFFADNPTTFKETIDMAVIAPEVAKVFQDHIAAKGFTDPAVGRAIASRLGLTVSTATVSGSAASRALRTGMNTSAVSLKSAAVRLLPAARSRSRPTDEPLSLIY